MADSRMVLDVLREARRLVEGDFGQGGNTPAKAGGGTCASLGICCACDGHTEEARLEAHRAFLTGAGLDCTGDRDAVYERVYAFNDAQTSVQPVLDAFDKAIQTIALQRLDEHLNGPTPNADATIAIMDACNTAGKVIARYIKDKHPQMDERELVDVVSAELFYAAQDTARGADLGVVVERP